ncbi:MAG TPA: DUF1343 domain-containing protein [Bacteroidales bacterium]|nr:DUF1343 domain-containing protein [Bacteroidales bacterium]
MKKYVFIALVILIAAASLLAFQKKDVIPGAERFDLYKDLIRNKNVGILANQTSMVGQTHLVDKLLSEGIRVTKIYAPEHGFRDLADAGETIENGVDKKTGIQVVSLYGNHHKPTPEDLSGIDVVLFDIQDVGTRFYTYISSLHYLLEACAENNVSCIILDRPNPNGFYIDGNILDTAYRSFVGMDPVPVVHGMTPGEYAMMANGEGWLKKGVKCSLKVITCGNYNHKTLYELPVKPSPNLPNQTSIYLYPSICFFEGTALSVGRGTQFPFQVFGSPKMPDRGFSFTPQSVPGAKNPPFLGQKCFGTDLREAIIDGLVPRPNLNLEWVINAYKDYPQKDSFFIPYFDVLAAGPALREQIIKGMTADQIRELWKPGLLEFEKNRKKYLLY